MTAETSSIASVSPLQGASQHAILEATLSEAVEELFASYGVTCTPGEPAGGAAGSRRPEVGAIIGVRGPSVRGGLAFLAPVELLAMLLPVPRKVESADVQMRDWCSEVANQLLGRLKNKLAAYSLDFDIGTPVCFLGQNIRLVFMPGAEGISVAFHAAALDFRAHLDCSVAPGSIREPIEKPRIAAEGEFILFPP